VGLAGTMAKSLPSYGLEASWIDYSDVGTGAIPKFHGDSLGVELLGDRHGLNVCIQCAMASD
jgi:hypothetical protein